MQDVVVVGEVEVGQRHRPRIRQRHLLDRVRPGDTRATRTSRHRPRPAACPNAASIAGRSSSSANGSSCGSATRSGSEAMIVPPPAHDAGQAAEVRLALQRREHHSGSQAHGRRTRQSSAAGASSDPRELNSLQARNRIIVPCVPIRKPPGWTGVLAAVFGGHAGDARDLPAEVGRARRLAERRLPARGAGHRGLLGAGAGAAHLAGERRRVQLLPPAADSAGSRSPTAATGWRWPRSCWSRWSSARWPSWPAAARPRPSAGGARPTWPRRSRASCWPASARRTRCARPHAGVAEALGLRIGVARARRRSAGNERHAGAPAARTPAVSTLATLLVPRDLPAETDGAAALAGGAGAGGARGGRAAPRRGPGRGRRDRRAAAQRRAQDGAAARRLTRPAHAADRDRDRRPRARLELADRRGARAAERRGGRGGRAAVGADRQAVRPLAAAGGAARAAPRVGLDRGGAARRRGRAAGGRRARAAVGGSRDAAAAAPTPPSSSACSRT